MEDGLSSARVETRRCIKKLLKLSTFVITEDCTKLGWYRYRVLGVGIGRGRQKISCWRAGNGSVGKSGVKDDPGAHCCPAGRAAGLRWEGWGEQQVGAI